MILSFRVLGDPKPKGSKTTGVAKSGARYVRETNKGTMPWVRAVKDASRTIMGHDEGGPNARPPYTGPVKVRLRFYLKRPKNHYRTNGALKWWAPTWREVSPDADKLARSVLDGLQPFVLKDDAQVCMLEVLKLYCPPGIEPGVHIELRELA